MTRRGKGETRLSLSKPKRETVSAHDELTAVDLPGAIRLASGQIKPRVFCCGGTGFCGDLLNPPYVVPCWCPAGLRMRSAREDWPLMEWDAEATAELIGLGAASG